MTASQRVSIRRQVALTQAKWMKQRRHQASTRTGTGRAGNSAGTRTRERRTQSSPRIVPGMVYHVVVNGSADCSCSHSAHVVSVACDASDKESTRWTSYKKLQELNAAMAFVPLTESESARLEEQAREQYEDETLDRKVCAVTDTWVFVKAAERVSLDDLPLNAMKRVLSGLSWATTAIERYYDCSDIDDRLQGLLLSRRAFHQDSQGRWSLWFSRDAIRDLRSIESCLTNTEMVAVADFKPPKFSIADSFVAGTFPEITRTTCVERQAIGLVQIRGVVKVVYGGPGNMLQSHLLCWDNRDATIASRVPSVLRQEHFQLILAGPLTQTQEIVITQRHECSGERVHIAHELLRRINPLYANVEVNDNFDRENLSEGTVVTTLDDNDDTQDLVANARARQSSVARMYSPEEEPTSRERTVIESQTVLVETVSDRTEQDRIARAYANVTGSTDRYVAKRSTVLLNSNDPSYIERLFPHLLTFGIGGLSTARQHRYGQRAIVLHYLNLSTNQFAEDPLFKLMMFDHLSSMRVKSSVFLRVGQQPALATNAMQISPEQLQTVMRNRANQRNAWKKGRNYVPTDESRLAAEVFKSVNASASKMWGSNEERESLTRKVDAMTIHFGAPSVFWTLTPNPDCSLTCAFWTGHELPSGRPDSLSHCSERNMPCNADMARLIMGNTVVQAQYYRVCASILIDVLFGWDSRSHKPKAERGIFGFTEALVYALEQQGRLFVHHHGAAWIAGMPKTQSDWDKLLADDGLKARFEQYCASIFAAELPIYDTVNQIICPKPTCDGELKPVTIPNTFKHTLKPTVPAPHVAQCVKCTTTFPENDIVGALLRDQWSDLDEAHQRISCGPAVEAIRHKFGGVSPDEATSRVQMTRLLLRDQVHAFGHSSSCVKGRRGTKCRYKFFRPLVESTGFDKNDEIVYRRRLGNQWLNTYIPVWRRIFHFNMDARVLWSGQSLQATRYALQYTMKRQTVLDNVAVVHMAFKRRLEREANMESTEYARGIGRLLSLAYSTSGVMEIGGPLATAILMEGDAVTFSCVFERLVLLEGLNLLNDDPVEAMVVARNDVLYTETSIQKYVQRPTCLEQYCWYDYCCWFHQTSPDETRLIRACSFTHSSNTELRDHLRKHNYRFHDFPHVPNIIGPRLPDATRLGEEDYEAQTELYYRMALLLHHPFRDVAIFLDNSGSAQATFEDWAPFAEKYRESQRTAREDDSSDDEVCLDDDVLQNVQSRGNLPASHHSYDMIPADMYCTSEDVHMDNMDLSAADHAETPTDMQELLYQAIASSTLPPDQTATLVASEDTITRTQVLNFTRQQHLVEVDSTAGNSTDRMRWPPTVDVTAYAQAVQDARADHVDTSVLDACATIHAVSRHFKLSSRQHIAFALIAVPMLSKITGLAISGERSSLFNTSPLIITGAGGTGKSRIIAAVRAFTRAWNRPEAVTVVASTGIAASSLKGCTMHSSVGLGINVTRLPKYISTPTDALLRQWSPVICVIADEVSMVDLGFLGLWEESLRYAKDNLDEPFGGMMAVLMFDHCQLRPVKGAPMYKTANAKSPLTTLQDRGRLLYRTIDKAIYLSENMRFTRDPEWGDWLASARLGHWPPSLQAFIASIPEPGSVTAQRHVGMMQTISTDNATRTAINDTAIQTAVHTFKTSRKIYVIPARMSRQLSLSELAVIRALPDNKTGNIPIFLHVYIGMPVRVKANQCLPNGVVNGASGIVYHIDWQPNTSFTLQPNLTWLASIHPNNIYVDLTSCASPTRFPALPREWPNTVMPVHEITASVTISGSPVAIKGFPIVPAFGTTVHGVQGETREAIAITNLRPPNCPNVDSHALYVALSRITTRHGLHWLGDRPTPADYNYFHPAPDVLVEDSRLKHLSEATITNFHRLAQLNESYMHV